MNDLDKPSEILVRVGVLLLHQESNSRLKRAAFQNMEAATTSDVLDEMMPTFEATVSEGKLVPCLF
ncbi:hypothetical protein D3C71_2007160 [compost metagenome]